MISVMQRAARGLRCNRRVFWTAVLVQSLIFCLLSQVFFAHLWFDRWESAQGRDQVTVFMDPSLSRDAETALAERIERLEAGLLLEKLEAGTLLQEKMSDLFKGRENLPIAYSVEFPKSFKPGVIGGFIKTIKEYKGVITVAADMAWIEKRRSLTQSAYLGVLIPAVPLFVLAFLVLGQGTAAIHRMFVSEESVLRMLGGSGWVVWGPAFCTAAVAYFYSIVIGILIFGAAMFLGLHLSQEIIDIRIALDIRECLTVLLVAAGLMFAAVSGFLTASVRRNLPEVL